MTPKERKIKSIEIAFKLIELAKIDLKTETSTIDDVVKKFLTISDAVNASLDEKASIGSFFITSDH